MENILQTPPARGENGQLKTLVDRILYSVLAGSVKRRNLVINDIPIGLPTVTDENLMSLILGNLLSDVVSHTENDCIRINASKNGNLALITMKNNTITFDKSFALCLQPLQVIVQKMGGVIKIDKLEGSGTVLAVSFNGNTRAA